MKYFIVFLKGVALSLSKAQGRYTGVLSDCHHFRIFSLALSDELVDQRGYPLPAPSCSRMPGVRTIPQVRGMPEDIDPGVRVIGLVGSAIPLELGDDR